MDSRYTLFEEASIAVGIELENVTLGQGQFGVCVLAKDASKPIAIRIPKHVLLPSDFIDFKTNTVKAEVETTDEVREYWNLYLATAFNDDIMAERKAIEKSIADEGLNDWQAEKQITILARFMKINETDEELRQTLSSARVLQREGTLVHMPYLDFANHRHPSLAFKTTENGTEIAGDPIDGEVFVSYGAHDSMKLLNTYGFFNPTRFAYAVPSSFNLSATLQVHLSNRVLDAIRDDELGPLPRIGKGTEGGILASYCTLGIKDRPRWERRLWRRAVERSVGLDSKEKQMMLNLFPSMQRNSWRAFWETYRRGEQVKDEQLRTLMMNASADTMRNTL
ncbi:MAG: hypothetical protein CBC49_004360 [Alphaproteobacteria bacterium TMED89]|nr:hypothetical protein [Rhodospirillaceae bacterium]RPH16201.1 MAG: hypothetical protein CBC49_004360 [Alphaproteobacteria bacterium TMED89]